MILQTTPPVHLTYCLNVHSGETWTENFRAIREKAAAVRERVSPSMPFGLGLRLSHRAACELKDPHLQAELLDFMKRKKLYIMSINGFPYGNFHGARVKEKVYQPDWRSVERRDYTLLLIQLLADLQLSGTTSSISTVPGSFKPWIRGPEDVHSMVDMLTDCILRMVKVREREGKEIHIGLEPEPGCFLESTKEFLFFYKDELLRNGRKTLADKLQCTTRFAEEAIYRHVGVCFDTCHLAIQFENLVQSLRDYAHVGVRLSKIQLSAAPEIPANSDFRAISAPFCEPVYLHQVKAKCPDGSFQSWNDLPEALASLKAPPPHTSERWRIHFHLPLFFPGTMELGTTASCLTSDFFQELKRGQSEHLEIETYTFDVLPYPLRDADVVSNIAREYAWVLKQFQL